MTLTGRVAVVTGASSGIGSAVAKALAAEGAEVAAFARRRSRLDRLAAEAARIVPYEVDLRDEPSTIKAFQRVQSDLGPVDILVNNAGLGYATGLLEGETEKWREMLDVNVLGLCICTREAIAQMRAHECAGHIVHISSMSAHRVPEGSGMYSATKFAVRSLTEALRMELHAIGSPIRVAAVSPGFVETEFAEKYHQDLKKARETYSRYEVLQPEDVAASVLHIVTAPRRVQIHDVLIRPTAQER